MEIPRVGLFDLSCRHTGHDFDSRGSESCDPVARHSGVRVNRPNNHPGHTGVDDRLDTRWSPAGVNTRLECHHKGMVLVHRANSLQESPFGMYLSRTGVSVFGNHRPIGRNENRPDPRVRVRAETGADRDCLSHDRLVVDRGHDVRRSMR
jgi:hypothetical protein